MLKEDFVIQSNVRQVLIRSDIDYSRITFGTVKGGVYLRGVFKSAFHHIQRSEAIWGSRH
jgi:hypothetical protein